MKLCVETSFVLLKIIFLCTVRNDHKAFNFLIYEKVKNFILFFG